MTEGGGGYRLDVDEEPKTIPKIVSLKSKFSFVSSFPIIFISLQRVVSNCAM